MSAYKKFPGRTLFGAGDRIFRTYLRRLLKRRYLPRIRARTILSSSIRATEAAAAVEPTWFVGTCGDAIISANMPSALRAFLAASDSSAAPTFAALLSKSDT